jgi:hypothetical protein
MPGRSAAVKLYTYATNTPSPIRVNILRLLSFTDWIARTKNGQAAQVQTGVARINSSIVRTRSESRCEIGCPGRRSPIARRTRGTVTAAANHNRRFISPSS